MNTIKENLIPRDHVREYMKKTRFTFYVLKDRIHGLPSALKSWIEKTAGRPLMMRDKIIGSILIILFLFIFYVVLDANKYRAMVNVISGEGRTGINPTSESLDFGDLSRGMSAVRKVNIENGTIVPMYVAIMKTGDVNELMTVSENNFRLDPRSKKVIEFSTYIPASAEIGKNYTGRVYLFKIPTFGL